ncbi:hypothetical protein BCY84_04108 [Trypanosoma cruzi cruzi]|nr:hypothetical protein BCY84_04108 [Trypanosoma cruzi cruzi]
MHIAVDMNAPFVVHAGSCVWRLLYSSVAMGRGEKERTPSLFSCGCDAPRVTALSWAPCPIDGGMAGNFLPRDGWMRVCLLRVRCVVAAGFWPFPWGCGNELGEMVVDVSSSCMVGGYWRCVPSLRGCRLVVCGLCGWACCPLLMLSALSRCIRCAPSISLSFHSFPFRLTDQLTDTGDSTTGDDDCDGDGAAPCWSLRSCAAAALPCALRRQETIIVITAVLPALS